MKKYLYVFIVVLIITIGFLLGKQYQEDQAFNDQLLLHQAIDIEDVIAMYYGRNDAELTAIDTNEDIINAFNGYPANQITVKNIDQAETKLVIELQEDIVIKILYADKKIYVKRNDVAEGEICYELIEGNEQLEAFFSNQ
ncbi:hypothetical protein SAMN04487943_106261 [Gracilibacillus orientalis]|uniref:Uncharacterized protein n=1 Tax=Gracilibacillus orientalis TaxID=334253 RepID=A0A1I4MGP1_9BACI|nr:hypothetical protein [Gracilibacillus orientalis]SFM02592.1 hypothetical protein SAMN04487943_106261 [Gracilibacillus orientalis]